MPRFFFNLAGQKPDEQGVELADEVMANTEAVAFLGAYLADNPRYASQGHWRVEVADEAGEVLLNVVVTLVPGAGPEHW